MIPINGIIDDLFCKQECRVSLAYTNMPELSSGFVIFAYPNPKLKSSTDPALFRLATTRFVDSNSLCVNLLGYGNRRLTEDRPVRPSVPISYNVVQSPRRNPCYAEANQACEFANSTANPGPSFSNPSRGLAPCCGSNNCLPRTERPWNARLQLKLMSLASKLTGVKY